jgi:hypothetical protein
LYTLGTNNPPGADMTTFTQVKKGDIVVLKKEYRDDDKIIFIAIDDEEKGRVTVEAEIGFTFNPTYVVTREMIESHEWEAE